MMKHILKTNTADPAFVSTINKSCKIVVCAVVPLYGYVVHVHKDKTDALDLQALLDEFVDCSDHIIGTIFLQSILTCKRRLNQCDLS